MLAKCSTFNSLVKFESNYSFDNATVKTESEHGKWRRRGKRNNVADWVMMSQMTLSNVWISDVQRHGRCLSMSVSMRFVNYVTNEMLKLCERASANYGVELCLKLKNKTKQLANYKQVRKRSTEFGWKEKHSNENEINQIRREKNINWSFITANWNFIQFRLYANKR